MHNEALLEIIILQALEYTIANSSFLLVTSFQSAIEVIVSLLLSNENANDSRIQTKILHDTKWTCALTQNAHDMVLKLSSWCYM